MATTMLEARVDSLMTTDGTWRGCDVRDLVELTAELTSALNGAIWSFMLRAELEDAFDVALFQAVMAETPTLSGAGLCSAA
jgi:hypothetical protein